MGFRQMGAGTALRQVVVGSVLVLRPAFFPPLRKDLDESGEWAARGYCSRGSLCGHPRVCRKGLEMGSGCGHNDVACIVVTYNSENHISQCLDAAYDAGVRTFVVVDNSPDSNTLTALKGWTSVDVQIVKSQEARITALESNLL